jgi:hypothetical protein
MATSIPPVSKEFFDKLCDAFPRVAPEPNMTTMDDLMYNAGSQAVLEWIRVKALRESTITGSLADVSQTVDVRKA